MKKACGFLFFLPLCVSCGGSESLSLTPSSLPDVFVQEKLTFDLNGGHFPDNNPVLLRKGNTITSVSSPIKTYSDFKEAPTFQGWYQKRDDLSTKITLPYTLNDSGTVFFAHYSFYLLTYKNPGDNSVYDYKTVELGKHPEDYTPESSGYTLNTIEGWYYLDADKKKVDFTTDLIITHDYVLYPKFSSSTAPGAENPNPTNPL
ncbi:MAG: InlB B-repeat-containing protein [Eubacteriales bacterium]|nr:InlB B-repeat-containing protein [Eubacteriales bacterium]